MKASTFKIENPLLDELNEIRPPSKSLSAFTREILEKAVQQEKMIQAAERYAEFLKGEKEEGWLEDWEVADLAKAPRVKKTKR